MGVGGSTTDLGANYPMGSVFAELDILFIDGFGEAGPAATRIILIQAGKQGFARDDINVDTLFGVVPILVLKWALCAVFLGNVELLWGLFFALLFPDWLPVFHPSHSFISYMDYSDKERFFQSWNRPVMREGEESLLRE